jgi:hypothetical protein
MYIERDNSPAGDPPLPGSGESRDAHFVEMLRAFRRSGGLARDIEILGSLGASRTSGRNSGCREATICFAWGGRFWLPWFQFDRADLSRRHAPARVIDELAPACGGWDMALWFASPNPWIAEARPIDLIDECPASVFAAARADRFIASAARPLRAMTPAHREAIVPRGDRHESP